MKAFHIIILFSALYVIHPITLRADNHHKYQAKSSNRIDFFEKIRRTNFDSIKLDSQESGHNITGVGMSGMSELKSVPERYRELGYNSPYDLPDVTIMEQQYQARQREKAIKWGVAAGIFLLAIGGMTFIYRINRGKNTNDSQNHSN